jgi:hypothetical protein
VTTWEDFVAINPRNVAVLREQLSRAEKIGLQSVTLPAGQIDAVKGRIASKISGIIEELGVDRRKQILTETRGYGSFLTRTLELLLTWAEVDPASEHWSYDWKLFNELEKGGWFCQSCGGLNGHKRAGSSEVVTKCACPSEERTPKGRGPTAPRQEAGKEKEEGKAVTWSYTTAGGRSVARARDTLVELDCASWVPTGHHHVGQPVTLRWPGPEGEQEGPATAKHIAAVLWHTLIEAGARRYIDSLA